MTDRNWPHPVLDESGGDYPRCAFQMALVPERSGGAFLLRPTMNLGSLSLEEAIARGDAAYAIRVQCSKTSYRDLFVADAPTFECRVPEDDLWDDFGVTPYIVARRAFDLASPEFDAVFAGLIFAVRPGDVLAVGPEREWEAEREFDPLRRISSILSIVRGTHPTIVHQFDNDRVLLCLPEAEFNDYGRFRNNPRYSGLFLVALAVPALHRALLVLRDDEDRSRWRWQRVLDRQLIATGAVGDYDDDEAFRLAQELLKRPLGRALRAIRDDAESDDQ